MQAMAEKKIQENPLPEESLPEIEKKETMTIKTAEAQSDKSKDTIKIPELGLKTSESTPMGLKVPEPTPVAFKMPEPVPAAASSPRWSIPSFTKTPPNDLYRRLLPAVLFVLTFVTVMTMLLIYMDTVALGGQQFRVNMSRDYELARIPQASAPLVAYVRQLHFAPPVAKLPPPPAEPTDSVRVLDRLYGEIYNGTFVEVLESGPRSPATVYLESARGWRGVAARAAARDYLALRCCARRAHAGLSPAPHPREVPYREAGAGSSFHARVLCLPLYTLLLAAEATAADYVILGGEAAYPALTHVPYRDVRLRVIEVYSSDLEYRNKTTRFLDSKNYTLAASFPDSVIYALKQH